ncbi:putative microtubule-associated protein Gb4, partial [Trypanosoma conorhini]
MHASHSRAATATGHPTPPHTRQTRHSLIFTSDAETLSPRPDSPHPLGPPQLARASNQSLMRVGDSHSHRPSSSRSWRSAASRHSPGSLGPHSGAAESRTGGNRSSGCNGSAGPPDDLGYWTVTFVTKGGDRVGASKVMAPRGKGPCAFEDVVGAIVENAALLGLAVAYVTYLDRDFHIYTLLTPQSVQNCTGTFRVVVESKEESSQLPPTPPQDARAGSHSGAIAAPGACASTPETPGVPTLMEEILGRQKRDSTATASSKRSTPGGGLFRNVPPSAGLWQQRRPYDLRTTSEKAQERREALEMALALTTTAEEGERRAIALDEGSSWATLAVMADRHRSALARVAQKRLHHGRQHPQRPHTLLAKGKSEARAAEQAASIKLQPPKCPSTTTAQASPHSDVPHGKEARELRGAPQPHPAKATVLDSHHRPAAPPADAATAQAHEGDTMPAPPVEREGTPTIEPTEHFGPQNDIPTNMHVHGQPIPSTEAKLPTTKTKTPPSGKATSQPSLVTRSLLAPPNHNTPAAPGRTSSDTNDHDMKSREEQQENEFTPTHSSRAYLRKRLASLTEKLQQLESIDTTLPTRPKANTPVRNKEQSSPLRTNENQERTVKPPKQGKQAEQVWQQSPHTAKGAEEAAPAEAGKEAVLPPQTTEEAEEAAPEEAEKEAVLP